MYLIGIVGPSCAGKGVLSTFLAEKLPAAILCIDAYYRPLDHLTLDERELVNYDQPGALDDALLEEHLCRLLEGHSVDRPVYDFALHTRSRETVRLEPSGFLLIEGLFTLAWKNVRSLLAASIFITAPEDVCLQRRIVRDCRERGRTKESVQSQYTTTVVPMRRMHIDPTAGYADLVLDGTRPIEESGNLALQFIRKVV